MKFILHDLVDVPYAYQPPEVRNAAVIFVKTKEGGMQIVDSYRDIVTIDGQEFEALILEPYQPLTAKAWKEDQKEKA